MGYQEHPSFEQPPDLDAPVWRYLNFTKLVALLTSHELYFARTDLLGDSFEGSYPALNVKLRPDVYRAMGRSEEEVQRLIL